MKLNTIDISADSRYKVNRNTIREAIEEILAEEKITSKTEVSVFVIGDRKMKTLNHTYRGLNETTDVLSFPLESSDAKPFVKPPDNMLRLGDIVISYPTAVAEAARNNILVDEEIKQLVQHGLLHLLGYDHDDEGAFNRSVK